MEIKIRFVTVCIFIVALTGCAAKSIRQDFSFNNVQGEGVVVFSVSHDLAGKRAAKAIFYMDGGVVSGGLTFFSLDDAFIGIPNGSEFKDSYGHLLVVSLPAGRHVIDYWQITSGTGLRIKPSEKPAPLVFEVVSGQVKYLGNLHANIQTGKNIFGSTVTGDGYPEVRDQQQRDIPMFENKYPQFKGKIVLDLLPVGPWVQSAENRKQLDVITAPPAKRSIRLGIIPDRNQPGIRDTHFS